MFKNLLTFCYISYGTYYEVERKRQRVKFEMEIKDECFSKCLAQIEPKYPKVIKKIKIKTKNNNCQKAIITNIRIQYPIYYLNKKIQNYQQQLQNMKWK